MSNSSSADKLKTQLVNVESGNEFSPREVLMKYAGYLPLFIVFLILMLSLTFLYIRYKNPVYSSSIKILVKDDSKKSGTDLSSQILSELIMSGKTNIANELEIVKSRTLMEKVVRNLHINITYYFAGSVRETELYDTVSRNFIKFNRVADSTASYEINIEVVGKRIFYLYNKKKSEIANHTQHQNKQFDFTVDVDDFSNFEGRYRIVWQSPEQKAKELVGQLSVEPLNKEASIVSITTLSEVPTKARAILNSLAMEYNKSNIDEKNQMIDNTIRFVDERLLIISGELGSVENNLQGFRQQNNVINVAAQEQMEYDRFKDIRSKIDEQEVRLKVADMVEEYVNNPARRFSLVPSSLGIEDLTLLELIKLYNEGVLQRGESLKTLSPQNIAIQVIEDRVEQLRLKILESVSNVKRSYQSAYAKLKIEYDQILQGISSIPQKQKLLLAIERQQGIKEKLYLYLLEKREESAISRASTIGNSVPLDPAITNFHAVKPQKSVLYVLAIVLALGIPFLLIYLRDLFNDKIITREDITKLTAAPVIGEINHHNLPDLTIVADKHKSIIAEQFRIIRTNLQYFLLGMQKKGTILITSNMSGEGKTFISMNMAAVLALYDKKVVLLEFDLRRPKISMAANIVNSTQGISTYLAGSINIEDTLKQVPGFENYYIMPCGPIPPNPAELLMSPRLDELFIYLKEHFDYIVIDCPPVGIVSDAKVLSKYSDLNFYILRQRYTFKKQLRLVNDMYENEIFKNMALVVNDVMLDGPNSYYGYGYSLGYNSNKGSHYYNYDYSYAYGYNNDAKDKKNIWQKIRSFFRRER